MATTDRNAARARPRLKRACQEVELSAPVPRRSRLWMLWTLGAVLAAIWSLPIFVAKTPLLNALARSAAKGLRGDLSVGSASLGWFSPIVLRDAQITDRDGQPVVRLAGVVGDRPLWRLALSRNELGSIRLEQPEAFVVTTPDGTNIEEVFARWLKAPPSLACPSVVLDVVGGTVTITDGDQDAEWRVEQINATVKATRDWAEPLSVELTAALPTDRGDGQIQATAGIERSAEEEGPPATSGRIEFSAAALPLELGQAMAQRFSPGMRLGGGMSAQLAVEWTSSGDAPFAASLDGNLSGEGLQVASPQWPDELHLASWKLPCRVKSQGETVTVEQLSLECDAGRLLLEGPITAPVQQPAAAEWFALLWKQDYRLEGQVDLAILAQLLPNTLRIREGTEITAGKLDIDLSHQTHKQGADWDARIEVAQLTAMNRGAKIEWRQPILLTVAARDDEQGPTIDKLICESKFLTIEATGALDKLTVSASCNLSELARQLEQFVNLDGLRLQGEGWSHANWTQSKDGDFNLESELQIRDLVLGPTGRQPWTEENLVITGNLAGVAEDRAIQRIDSATFDLQSGSDTARLTLAQPITEFSRDSDWPLSIEAQGQLATWLPRLEPIIGRIEPWNLAGHGRVKSVITVGAERIRFDDTTARIDQFQAVGERMQIDELKIDAALAGEFAPQSGQLSLTEADVTSDSVAMKARDITCRLTPQGMLDLQGTVSYSADLGRVAAWLEDPQHPSPRRLAGALQGRLDLIADGEAARVKFDALIENLGVADERAWLWQERSIELTGEGRYDPAQDKLQVDRLAVDADMLRIDSAGQLTDLHGARDIDLRGKMGCDMQKLALILQPYIGQDVQIVADREPQPFSLTGSLAEPLKTLNAEGGVAWTGADVHGFPVGPAQIRGRLAEGMLQIQPLDVVVSDGRLTTAPRLRVWPEPRELELDKGPLLTQVHVTPEMCSRGLRFVMPIVSQATRTEGTFSIELDDWQIPLGSPERGEPGPADADLSGRVTINSIVVEPGPVVGELAVFIDTIRRLLTGKSNRTENGDLPLARLRKESVVPFRMVQGRVYHRDLILDFDDVTVQTYGSVGLDQSLALMIQLKIPDRWATGGPVRTALKGKTIELPLGGTLKDPKLDQSALTNLTGQLIQGGLEGKLLDGLKGGLKGKLGDGLKGLFEQ